MWFYQSFVIIQFCTFCTVLYVVTDYGVTYSINLIDDVSFSTFLLSAFHNFVPINLRFSSQ